MESVAQGRRIIVQILLKYLIIFGRIFKRPDSWSPWFILWSLGQDETIFKHGKNIIYIQLCSIDKWPQIHCSFFCTQYLHKYLTYEAMVLQLYIKFFKLIQYLIQYNFFPYYFLLERIGRIYLYLQQVLN